MSATGPDAIVVGAGPNGLAAAIEIARAGRSVILYEAHSIVGGGCRTSALTAPGYLHDVCAAVHPLLLASPFFRSLPLEDMGVEPVHPPLPLAHPCDGGTAAILSRSLDETVDSLGTDGHAYRRMMAPLLAEAEEIVETSLAPLRVPRHPVTMAAFGTRALIPATTLARRTFATDRAQALLAGIAAHSILPLTSPPTAGVALFLALLAHHVGWPFVRGGSQRIADGMATYLERLGGEIVTDHEVSSLDDLPRVKAYVLDVTPRQLLSIAGGRFNTRYTGRLARYRYGPGVFKLDWALSAPVPWTAEECRRAGTIHLGASLTEIVDSEQAAHVGRHPDKPYVLLSQPTIGDATRAPAGHHVLWGYCHVPHGSGLDMTQTVERQIERFAPGFRDVVLERVSHRATEMEQYNANYVGGDIQGGMLTLGQLFMRPTPRWSPYTTPADDVFMCSSSTPPGAGVHGMCGYFAAHAALKRRLA